MGPKISVLALLSLCASVNGFRAERLRLTGARDLGALAAGASEPSSVLVVGRPNGVAVNLVQRLGSSCRAVRTLLHNEPALLTNFPTTVEQVRINLAAAADEVYFVRC